MRVFRRMIRLGAAALAPLVGLSGAGCNKASPGGAAPPTDPGPPPAVKKKPAPTPRTGAHLGRIEQVTAEARAVASGARGQHPFDRAGKEKLLAALRGVEQDVDALAAAGQVSQGAAGLWKQDLRQLSGKVSGYRPTEMRMASCYEPMPMPVPAKDSLVRLKLRADALGRLAAAEKLNARVVRRVLRQVRADLAVLEQQEAVAALGDAAKVAEARALAKSVRADLDRIQARLPGGDADRSAR